MNEGVDMVIVEPVIENLPLPAITDQLHLAQQPELMAGR